nr:ubiquinol-cytochrome C chaperone family protein [Aurantimonas sp. VKM B-3413]
MLESWRTRRRNRVIVARLYETLVTLTRRPDLYGDLGIADTFSGRFEALSIHVHLFLRRCRIDPALAPLAQDIVDRFISDVEDSIREIGIGDQSVPKRMRGLTGVFYERVAAYDAALGDGAAPEAALAEALRGRAIEAPGGEDESRRLATYMRAVEERFRAIPADAILQGRLEAEIAS